MSRKIAEAIVLASWNGTPHNGERLNDALHTLGIEPSTLRQLQREMRRVTLGKPRHTICTPTGAGKRR